MQVSTRAIVLREVKYGDGSVIVDMLTREQGRVSFICRISRSGRGRVGRQYFQPLRVLDIVYDQRPRASLQRLGEVRLAMPLASVYMVAQKLGIVLFLSEFLSHATRGEQQNAALFQYVEQSLEWLDATQGRTGNFHLVFMMRVSRFLGLFPNLEGYHEGDIFDLREGAFARRRPLHADYVGADDAAHIITLMRVNYQTMHLIRISREERGRILTAILYYYRLHIAAFPELRSPDVLQELYNG